MSENSKSVLIAPEVAAGIIKMLDEQSTPSSIIQRFIQSANDGNVRTELAEDCQLNFFGRHISGIDSVTGYMRTQLMGRYKHASFREAQPCDPADEVILKERFARIFDRTRRRLHQQKERVRATTLHLLADSDDEEVVGRGSTLVPSHLVTPPRPSMHNMELLTYIQAKGMLESIHGSDDGGVDLGDSRQVLLTLAYRREHSDEIYLALYEKFRQLRQKSTRAPPTPRAIQLRRHWTDTEEQEPTTTTIMPQPRGVRRLLFVSGSDDLQDDTNAVITSPLVKKQSEKEEPTTASFSPSRSLLTPRKRHHGNQTDVEPKRPAGLRFYV
ncbi:cell cycle negative regulator roughex [Drosophila tropicalis]|uniref:cell cycle negative regulator roughex n=1 Tax=Drosophila tropicalis TaxID=46794 RepID=UPI0035AB6BA9